MFKLHFYTQMKKKKFFLHKGRTEIGLKTPSETVIKKK